VFSKIAYFPVGQNMLSMLYILYDVKFFLFCEQTFKDRSTYRCWKISYA